MAQQMAQPMSQPMLDYGPSRRDGYGTTIAMLLLATLSVVLRFAIRSVKGTRLGLDDWMIIPGLLTFYGFTATIIWQVSQGAYNYPVPLMSPHQRMVVGKVSYIAPIFSVPAISFAKLSILCLYHKVFISPTFRKWNYVVGATVVAWMIACGLTTILRCLPPSALWNPAIRGRCVNFKLFFEIIEPINCAQDLVMAVMPIGVIKTLHLNLKQKISLSLIFILGSLVAVISLVRIALIANPNTTPSTMAIVNSKWLTIQLAVAILCANMLTYRALLSQRFIPPAISTWLSSLLSRRSSGGRSRSTEPREQNFELPQRKAGSPDSDPYKHGTSVATSEEAVETQNGEDGHQGNQIRVERSFQVV